MSDAHLLGQKGEELAVDYLKKAGFNILFRNWKWGKHEIDIIAGKKELIVFVEVKTRTHGFSENPLLAITREKQRSIILAADGYLQKTRTDKESRFDVITIINKGEDFEIDHIEGAFYPTLR
jgi:putative endonuclease